MSYASVVRPNQDQLDDLVLRVLPEQGRWTAEDYLWLTDHTNQLIELTDGFLEVLPVPTDRHQTLLLFLHDLLRKWAVENGGKAMVAPMRLRVGERKFREPDVMLLRNKRDVRRGDRYWSGVDLAVEVVSPDKPSRDLVEKREDYAQAGVPEYWIVEPVSESVTVLVLREGVYCTDGCYRVGETARSALLEGCSFKVADLFEAD